ncbi:uncharacterized protein LOC117103147 [Anneissia japonica]|uniref:uncharacterized protein LOC117103147 n=1 Tax=Anneissia japonica TaxID=1529436 RepID=UPI00142599A8|nr:uncharacterized protein LOC117103147 [Anneissia japonica]
MEFERFIRLGEEIGLEGADLISFAKERERCELERVKLETAKQSHDHETLKLRQKIEQIEIQRAEEKEAPYVRAPKLPAFMEGRDDMDAFIHRFENYATAQKWNRGTWATNLGTLLTGKGLHEYSKLQGNDVQDYDKLKMVVLKVYNLTEEGFRSKFRYSRPEFNETGAQFMTRLSNYFDRWVDMSNVENSMKGIRDLVVREQFLSKCSKDLDIFVRERKHKNGAELVELVDQYLEARGHGLGQASRPSSRVKGDPLKGNPTGTRPPSPHMDRKEGRGKTCFICNRPGHFARDCVRRPSFKGTHPGGRGQGYQGKNMGPSVQYNPLACMIIKSSPEREDKFVTLKCGHKVPVMSVACNTGGFRSMPVVSGRVGSVHVTVLRDSGCSGVLIRRALVSDGQLTGEIKTCVLIDGTIRDSPVAIIDVDTPYFAGRVEALCMEQPIYDLILGNLTGIRDPSDPDPLWSVRADEERVEKSVTGNRVEISAVVTRGQQMKLGLKPFITLKDAAPLLNSVTRESIRDAQEKDGSLGKIKQLVLNGNVKWGKKGSRSKFAKAADGFIYREFQSPIIEFGKMFRQIVVPQPYREQVLKIAHESILGGHQGAKKSSDRVLAFFYWPGVISDVKRYCKSCDICQRTIPKGLLKKVPLGGMPLVDTPFDRVAMDIVGPRSGRGNRYILTLVDYATRYPEAVVLPSIEAERVAEAMVNVFSRVGIPKQILTDQGAQFTSQVMKEVSRLLSFRQMTTTPYHPSCNGLVERFNGTLKRMLMRMCEEKPQDWDRYLNPLLFAYREAPQESTRFSPFELLYGRTVRGPLCILKELWSGEVGESETKTTYQYVLDLRERLEKTCDLAQQELTKSQKKYKGYYDRKTRPRQYQVGDEVLLLLPTDKNKLLMHWKGPFPITKKVGVMDYTINLGTREKTFHANLLKKYYRRPVEPLVSSILEMSCAAIINEDDPVNEESVREKYMNSIDFPVMVCKEYVVDVHVGEDLTAEQRTSVSELLDRFENTLTDVPGRTNLGCHDIQLTDLTPIRTKPYPIPYTLRKIVDDEVEMMLRMKVIEPSISPYSHPLVIVKKPDGSYRICVDMRKLNLVTIFDAEPIPQQDDILVQLAKARYFSKIDLSKDYWQVPLSDRAKPLTAFSTREGLFQFRMMPFGLINAPTSFSRIMRKCGLHHVVNYIDDILVFTETWIEHIETLSNLFIRLKEANLTARPTKCYIGLEEVEFLCHLVGHGLYQPIPGKLKSIQNVERPRTNKQLRSFLGLANYYRNFIPNFAAIAAPLTDKTRKGEPNKLIWERNQIVAFDALKCKLGTSPILHLPDLNRMMILRTDASNIALGAMLLQEFDGHKFPIAFISKKLNQAQRNYATIERECLAIVWAIHKFEPYLYGREFVIETDHQPLLCMPKSKVANG